MKVICPHCGKIRTVREGKKTRPYIQKHKRAIGASIPHFGATLKETCPGSGLYVTVTENHPEAKG